MDACWHGRLRGCAQEGYGWSAAGAGRLAGLAIGAMLTLVGCGSLAMHRPTRPPRWPTHPLRKQLAFQILATSDLCDAELLAAMAAKPRAWPKFTLAYYCAHRGRGSGHQGARCRPPVNANTGCPIRRPGTGEVAGKKIMLSPDGGRERKPGQEGWAGTTPRPKSPGPPLPSRQRGQAGNLPCPTPPPATRVSWRDARWPRRLASRKP